MNCNLWIFVSAVVACMVCRTTSHVALTFPPARTYDLDFLDSGRTPGPCGMPKGKSLYIYNIIDNYSTPVVNVGQQSVLHNVTFVVFNVFSRSFCVYSSFDTSLYAMCVTNNRFFYLLCRLIYFSFKFVFMKYLHDSVIV